MPQRTSAYEILARYWVFAFILSLPIGIPAILVGAISLPFLALIALLTILFFNFVQWIGGHLFSAVFFSDDEEYRTFRESGGDPWFHLGCPPPFNNDSEQLRITGSDAPAPQWVCRNCGVSMSDPNKSCRVCRFGRWRSGQCGSVVLGQFTRCAECGNHPQRKRGTP